MMKDPAVEAVRRSISPAASVIERQTALNAAREALKPIREAIEKIPAGLDAVELYEELLHIYNLTGGHCEECRK